MIKKIAYFLFIFLLVLSVQSQNKVYKNFKENERTFFGVKTKVIDPKLLDCIPIGLFVPAGHEILRGVILAIDEENEKGGFEGKRFCIKRRWSEDPWRSGSRDVIDLIYKDHVLGIIAHKNGASHIALQIAAKIHITVLSPITTDPSLTMTGVPWIFRLAPDDKKQAEILYRDGIKKKALRRLGIISETAHDFRIAATEMIKVLEDNKNPPIFHMNINKLKYDSQIIEERIKNTNPDGILLSLSKKKVLLLLSIFQKRKMTIPIFTTWISELRSNELKRSYLFPFYFIEPFSLKKNLNSSIGIRYLKRHKSLITYSAIYAYDCTKMLIGSIKKHGLNRASIMKGIKELSGYKGISGEVLWNNSGSNKTYPVLTLNKYIN